MTGYRAGNEHRLGAFALALAAVLPGGASLAAAHAAPVASAAERNEDLHDTIAGILAGSSAPAGRKQALVKLGPVAVPACFDLLSRRVQPRADSGAPLLDTAALAPLYEAFEAWESAAVVEGLIASVADEPSFDEVLLAVELLGRFGRADGFGHTLTLLAGLQPGEARHPSVRDRVEPALAALLRRDPASFVRLHEAQSSLDRVLLELCARAAGSVGDARAVSFLRGLLSRDSGFEPLVLEALGELRPWDPNVDLEACGELAESYLASMEPKTRRQAAVTLGRLRYADSLEDLIGLLDDDDARVSRGALWAVQNVTGLGWSGDDVGRWEIWYADEQDWLELELPAALRSVHGVDFGRAVAGLRVIGEHASFRRDLAPEVAQLLTSRNEGLALTACATLLRLDDPSCAPQLIQALEDNREGVRQAAARALSTLTGASLPPSAEAWRDWIQG